MIMASPPNTFLALSSNAYGKNPSLRSITAKEDSNPSHNIRGRRSTISMVPFPPSFHSSRHHVHSLLQFFVCKVGIMMLWGTFEYISTTLQNRLKNMASKRIQSRDHKS